MIFLREKKTILHVYYTIENKHVFSCIDICKVPRVMLKTKAEGRGFQLVTRDLAIINISEKCLIVVIA